MTAVVHQWIAGRLDDDVQASLGRLAAGDDIAHIAVMPDAHLAWDVCIGVVLGARSRLYPQAVGGDIGCGMASLGFHADADRIDDASAAARLLTALGKLVPANRHSARTQRQLPERLRDRPLSNPKLEKLKSRDGRVQFGTLGRGNHFLECQRDESGRLWVTVHSGSRAMGQEVRELHMERAATDDTGLRFLDAKTEQGVAYLEDLEWCTEYASRNREAMLDAVVTIMGELFQIEPDPESLIDCHHNFARREEHGGRALWVHRKGALSAREGEAGIIPGSMGASTFHVTGRGCSASLCSSSHGAGRALSRTEARRVMHARRFRREMRGVWFDPRMERRLFDEAPSAYKNIRQVMKAQRELTRVVRRLEPVVVYKGG